MSNPQRISFDPDPPVAGEDVTICYDFAGSGIESTLLEIDFEPGSNDDTDEQVSVATPCVTLQVPDGAEDVKVTDGSDKSPPNARVIATGGGD